MKKQDRIQEMKFILPSEAQQAIFHFGLRDKYLNTDFKKYTVQDFGERKIMNICRFDKEFRRKLTQRNDYEYSRLCGFNRWLMKLKKSRFVFYDEEEVMDWIYINTNTKSKSPLNVFSIS